MIEIALNVERGETEIPVVCSFRYYRGGRGSCDRYGVPLEPDTDPEISLVASVRGDTGETIELSPDEIIQAEKEAWAQVDA